MRLSVVIPAHDEAGGLRTCIEETKAVLEPIEGEHEIVVVDDGSTDETWAEICDLAVVHPEIRGIRLSRNFGKEAAITAGLRHATGDAVVVMDADLQHPPSLIPRLLEPWRTEKAAVVEAVKARRQPEPLGRRAAARLYYAMFRIGSGLELRDSSDFKLLDRRVVDQYLQLAESRRFFRGLTTWLGYPTVQVPMEPGPRQRGTSSWRLGALLELARRTLVSFSSVPLRMISWVGILGLLFSAGLGVQTLWYKLAGYAEEGFPTVIILVLGMGSAILLSLGLIGEYVASIYEEVKRRPSYVVLEAVGGIADEEKPGGLTGADSPASPGPARPGDPGEAHARRLPAPPRIGRPGRR